MANLLSQYGLVLLLVLTALSDAAKKPLERLQKAMPPKDDTLEAAAATAGDTLRAVLGAPGLTPPPHLILCGRDEAASIAIHPSCAPFSRTPYSPGSLPNPPSPLTTAPFNNPNLGPNLNPLFNDIHAEYASPLWALEDVIETQDPGYVGAPDFIASMRPTYTDFVIM